MTFQSSPAPAEGDAAAGGDAGAGAGAAAGAGGLGELLAGMTAAIQGIIGQITQVVSGLLAPAAGPGWL